MGVGVFSSVYLVAVNFEGFVIRDPVTINEYDICLKSGVRVCDSKSALLPV